MPRTITARENDRNGFKIVGNLKERGKAVDLTGFAVFYEAISPLGFFVRDIAVITNFRDGVFEYTVSKEAVSSAGVWVGYFAFEKGTERFTTQDIRISLGSDVKSGSVQLENYIAEFDKLKKQIVALQVAVDKADVVKRSGDTMTGNLDMDITGGFKTLQWTAGGVKKGKMTMSATGASLQGFPSTGGTKTAWAYNHDTDAFNILASGTNVLKKAGDTMSGNLTLDRTGTAARDILWSKDGVVQTNLGMNSANKLRLYDNVNALTVFEHDITTKTFSILADFKTKNDTDWTPLTLLNGVKQQSSQPASAVKRSGNVVNIVCAITDFKDKQVIANVPAIFRPDREMLFTCNYFQGLVLKNGYVIVKPNGDIYLEGIEATVSLYRFALTYIV
ncbi:TPA: BppU family phage baseplate upper protein [Bacillus wiedmannii]|nr:BppU family phage baseplate upper protein [Bacillus wiedmannii]